MDAAYRSTKSPFTGATATRVVGGNRAPELFADAAAIAFEKDQVLADALSEYCRLKEDGQAPRVDEFCRRYPTYHKSIQRMIDVEETLDKLDDFDDVPWPEVGSHFMGFDVLHELGVGAFARVYLATEPALGGRLVAVKVAMYGGDEAETLGKLDHPNVVPVHSVRDDSESGMTAVCMPYLGSATLSDVIEQVFQDGVPRKGETILQAVAKREILPDVDHASGQEATSSDVPGNYVDSVVRLGIQMAEALVYTHRQGVLHRDLKPSNVLITPAGQPKLLDFNLSCDVQTEVNRLGGTLPYMPPEQIKDVFLRPYEAKPPTDPRSDIFSLGVILYELFSGQLPFGIPPANLPPAAAGEIYLRGQQLPPPPLESLNPAIDSQTARLIGRCIAPDPDQRPKDAASLVAELENHFSPRRQMRRWSATHKKTSAAACLVMLMMALAFGWHLKTRPTLDRRVYNRGLHAMEDGDYLRAITYFDQAHELNPDEPAIRLARGLCHEARSELKMARKDFRPIANEEAEPILKEVFAYSHFVSDKENFAEAVFPYGDLVKDDPANIALRVNLAFANYAIRYGRKTPPGNALRQSLEILEMDPTCRAASHIRTKCSYDYLLEYQVGDPVDVLQDVETTLALGPSTYDLESMRIRLLEQIATGDPVLQEALREEMKQRLPRIAPLFQREQLDLVAKRLNLNSDREWYDRIRESCRTTPEPDVISQIVVPPNEADVKQYLMRPWHSS